MSIRYLDENGAVNFWTNIKNFVLSKIPTKTSELANDSGYLTQHQSLSNYVTLNSSQTITGIKTITGGNQGKMVFKNPNFTVGTTPEATTTVTRIYFGGGASYDGSTGVITNDITSDGNSQLEICALNNNSSSSYRASLILRYEQDQTRPRFIKSWGDFCPYSDNTYYLGRSDLAWKDAYINNVHGISDYTNFLTSALNANTTLTHASHGRRPVLAMGMITLTIPVPVEGSWFLIKAVNGQVTLNLASNVTVTGITAGAFSGPIHLQPNESILLCYYSSTIYNATISTIRRSGVIGRTGGAPAENPKNWFKIAENYVTATYRDPFICLRVFESTTGNTIGTLCAHCRINNTVGVVDTSNCYLQWQDAGAGIDLSKYALTTNETSGTGVTITLWCQLAGGYSSLKFEVVSECGQSDQIGNPEWILVRRRQTDGDLAELLDTNFTKIVYSTLTTLKNDTTGNAKNVTGTVAIANGGTGATTRLNAVKALTNESVASPTHFLTITTNWGKAGYTNVAQAKTVLGITGDIGSHSDSEYVHKSGDESITGTKTFGNGTLIVDNSVGSNVHGEIKLNGSRPGYIVADNAADGVFDNNNCGVSILLQDSGKPLHIGGYKVDSNGRVFADNTNKNPVLSITSNLIKTSALVPENDTTSSTFRILSQLDYANGDASKVLDVRFQQYDNASASSVIFSNADRKTALGSTSKRWGGVYATNYYYGTDNTEFSTKFVTSDTTQTISGAKTFSSTITGDISGNASTATEFSANKDVTLTGDVTGTASSKAGWSVSTTLSNSGVTAGTYGPSADVTGSNNATILVPEITVDAKGRVTAVNNRTYTSVNTDSDKKVYQYYKSDDNVYRLLFSNNAGNTATSNVGAVYSGLNNSFYVNPSTGSLYATKLYSNGVEVLTSHQSLSSCVKNSVTNNQTIKSTGITRGTAPSSAQTFGLGFSDNNNKYIGNVYGQYATDMSTYVGLYAYKGSTTTNGDNASVRVGYDASGNAYTYAPTPATADNSTQIATTAFVKAQGYLTSHQSLANYVTLNTNQTISAIKSHSKHISILGDYVGNESSTNGRSCLYLKANRDTDGKSGLYVTKFRQSVAQGSMGSSDVVFLSHDILENETRTNAGFVESYSNWSSDVPGGMSIYSSIATRNLGTSAKPWTNAYITNLNLNGNVFDPVSTSGNVGDIVFASAYYSSIMGTSQLGLTVSGDALYLACFDNNTLVIDSSASSLPGTWKFLGRGKPTTTSGNADTKRVGLWKRIA